MYRCKECNEEYKVKPDYCKCGNDEFEEFIVEESIQQYNSPKTDFGNVKVQKLIPVITLLLCIVLAIIPWCISTTKDKSGVVKEESPQPPQIAEIDKIWQEDIPLSPQSDSIKQEEKVDLKVNKPVNKPVKVKNSQKETKKDNIKPSNKSTQKKQIQTQKPVDKVSKPNPSSTLQNKQINNQVKEILKTDTPPAPQPPKMNQEEFLQYKASIRTALLSKLNIVNIQGAGECAIEFSLDNQGKLLNRTFIYKSQNKSLNDEVYLMLMRLPYFKTPPTNYRGEKIKIKIYINNGYYELSFI